MSPLFLVGLSIGPHLPSSGPDVLNTRAQGRMPLDLSTPLSRKCQSNSLQLAFGSSQAILPSLCGEVGRTKVSVPSHSYILRSPGMC